MVSGALGAHPKQARSQRHSRSMVAVMLTISRLKRFSIAYYNDTANQATQAAMDRRRANGGLGEYYSEGETRIATWLVIGDTQNIGQTTGLTEAELHGGDADSDAARVWLDEGRAPNGAHGRAFTDKSVHGFDLTFAAPKSVSLIRALADDVAEKVLAAAHTQGGRGRDGLPASARRLHPGAQPAHRQQRPAAAARAGGDRLPARDLAMRGPAPAHPRHRAQPPAPGRRPTGSASTPSRCITRPRPPASSTRPRCATNCTPSGASN